MNKQIKNLIEQFPGPKHFTCVPLNDEDMKRIHDELGVTLPQQYLDYLNEYSWGGVSGIDILGKGFEGSLGFLDTTLDYRKLGLPKNLVAVENCDEWLYCIDCDTGKVVSWDPFEGVLPGYDCFDDFLLDRINDSIENL